MLAIIGQQEHCKPLLSRSSSTAAMGRQQYLVFTFWLLHSTCISIVRRSSLTLTSIPFRVFALVHVLVLGQSGFGKEERQTLTDEEQAAKREERHQALSAQRDKVRRSLVTPLPLLLLIPRMLRLLPSCSWWWWGCLIRDRGWEQ